MTLSYGLDFVISDLLTCSMMSNSHSLPPFSAHQKAAAVISDRSQGQSKGCRDQVIRCSAAVGDCSRACQ